VYGGGNSAVNAVPADATAFAHRDAFLVYQLYASSITPPYPKDGIPFVDGMVSALEPNPRGAYPNYMDPTLTPHEWRRLYFGEHVERLEGIKRAVDPEDVFKFVEGF
jgi:Berberine and berberine like